MKKDCNWDDLTPDRLMQVSPQERHEMIAVGAYFRAERRSFAPGQELQDWWEAAASIDRMLDKMRKAGVSRRQYEEIGLRNALRLWVDDWASPEP